MKVRVLIGDDGGNVVDLPAAEAEQQIRDGRAQRVGTVRTKPIGAPKPMRPGSSDLRTRAKGQP